MPSIAHLLRPDITALEPYTPVAPIEVLAERLGLPVDRIIKLDANESPYGASPRALAALAALGGGQSDHGGYGDPSVVAIYPDPNHAHLREKLSAYTGQPTERILCDSGSGELIDLLMRAILQPGDKIVDCPPTFGMYSFDAGIHGARVVNVPRDQAFDLDVEAIADAAEQHGAKLLFVTLPNNPTGNLTARRDIERLLDLPLLVVVDEAYVEFAGATVVDMVGAHPNLAVLRTFSKWAGLAGLRVGYAIAHPELAGYMLSLKQPYNVNVAADTGARAAIAHFAEIKETIASIVAERDRMAALCEGLGWLKPLPSQANFVLFQVEGRAAKDVAAGLRTAGVLVRYYDRPDLANYVRISAGRPEDTDRLIEALRAL